MCQYVSKWLIFGFIRLNKHTDYIHKWLPHRTSIYTCARVRSMHMLRKYTQHHAKGKKEKCTRCSPAPWALGIRTLHRWRRHELPQHTHACRGVSCDPPTRPHTHDVREFSTRPNNQTTSPPDPYTHDKKKSQKPRPMSCFSMDVN